MKTMQDSRLLRPCFILFAALCLMCTANAGTGQAGQVAGAPMGAQPAPAQGQMLAQPASICGNQPLCYDTPDFVATVTDFRTSNQNGINIIDVGMRFQNKLNQAVILGYADGSLMALDDQGNRYVPNPWGNAVRGMGVVAGNNMDPKFVLRPGGYGDARFELVWRPGQGAIGSTFELDLSTREINTLEGNQHSLGGEFPIVFRGLANGVAAAAPAMAQGQMAGAPMSAAGAIPGASTPSTAAGQMFSSTGATQAAPACNPASSATALAGATNSAAAQNTAATANTAVANATAALSSLSSIFGKKKPAAAAPAAGTSAAAAPCPPGTNPAAGGVSNVASTVGGAAPAGVMVSAGLSLCAGKPHCSETPDFAATITSFRTAAQGNTKVVDAVVHFQNKTNSPLILGYVLSTGTATDDRGNRYIVNGGNGFTGIGYVSGGNFDPRFVVQPGGAGDARFELMWNPPAQANSGSNFELDVAVDEINTVQGNQHTLGGQFPLRFPGLTNGLVAAAAPPAAAAAKPAAAKPVAAAPAKAAPVAPRKP